MQGSPMGEAVHPKLNNAADSSSGTEPAWSAWLTERYMLRFSLKDRPKVEVLWGS
jgi:hypothetical protein